MWVNYLGLWLLFLFFLFLTVAIWQYSRWQIKGPIWKMKWRQFKQWILRENKGSVKISKKGSVIVADKALKDIEAKKKDLSAAQDYLEIQGLETKLEKEKEEALKIYKSKNKDGKSFFKRFKPPKKKDKKEKEVEVTGKSIFEELGSGDSAQDLLHKSDFEEKTDNNIEESKSIFDTLGVDNKSKDIVEEVDVADSNTISQEAMSKTMSSEDNHNKIQEEQKEESFVKNNNLEKENDYNSEEQTNNNDTFAEKKEKEE